MRDYTALMQQLKKLSPDWSVNNISMESDILANQLDLLNYSRDLWKTNPYLQAYADEMVHLLSHLVYSHLLHVLNY